MFRSLFLILQILVFILSSGVTVAQKPSSYLKKNLYGGGLYVKSSSGEELMSYNIDKFYVPASAIKLATSLVALDLLGENFHFKTEFYQDKNGDLYVKGYGDPGLVSEEFPKIAEALMKKNVKEIQNIHLDDSYFSTDIQIDGASESKRAYDSQNGALVANFNTIFVRKLKSGQVISAEEQTPLVPLAKERASLVKPGKHRMNVGQSREAGLRYFGEMFTHFLKEKGIDVKGKVRFNSVADSARLIHTHQSSKALREVVKDLLEYSTNFTTNQIMLVLGVHEKKGPATVEKGMSVVRDYLQKKLNWKDFQLVEASGLSRQNQVTPHQMMTLLEAFHKYKELLPLKEDVFRAKTGTLKGVSTLAGWTSVPGQGDVAFVILVNDPKASFMHKFTVAKQMRQELENHSR